MSWVPVSRFSAFLLGVSVCGSIAPRSLAQAAPCTDDSIQAVILTLPNAESEAELRGLLDTLVQCDAQAVPFLVDALGSSLFSSYSIRVLAEIGPEALEIALSNPDELERIRAQEALGKWVMRAFLLFGLL